MTSAGNSWTQDNFVPFDLPTLQGYDGVFLGWAPDENDVPHDNEVLVRYLNAGGNVYVFGAGNNDEDANHWNGFLNQFGLSFKTFGNEIDGDIPINSAHPIFVGVDHLFQMHGTSILDLQPSDPRNQVLVTYNGEGLYAVYDVPEPSVLVMLLAAALGWSIHVWRKRR
jgi:hypothetical protein